LWELGRRGKAVFCHCQEHDVSNPSMMLVA